MLTLNPFSLLGFGTAVAETARTLIVVVLMAWSIGAFGTTTPQRQNPEPLKPSPVQSSHRCGPLVPLGLAENFRAWLSIRRKDVL
jgi:hypothetical protein